MGSDCQERDTKGKKTIKSNALVMTFLETSAVFSLIFENKPPILFIVRDIIWSIYCNFFSYLSNSQKQVEFDHPSERSPDSEDDYLTGCRNVSHCQQQQSCSGIRSPRPSNSTYF